MINHPPPPPPMPNDTPTGICGDFGRAGRVGEWVWLTHSSQTGMFLIKYIIYCIVTKSLHSYNHPLPRSSRFEGFFLPPATPPSRVSSEGAVSATCHPSLARNMRRRSATPPPSRVSSKGQFLPPANPLSLKNARRRSAMTLPLAFRARGRFLPPASPPSLKTQDGGHVSLTTDPPTRISSEGELVHAHQALPCSKRKSEGCSAPTCPPSCVWATEGSFILIFIK